MMSNTPTSRILTHSEKTLYTCLTCGKSFKSKGNLKIHQRIHTGERPYVCSVCDKSFSQNSNLVTHISTHSDETLHACPTCGKSFKLKRYLKQHFRVHTKDASSVSSKHCCPRRKNPKVSETPISEAKEVAGFSSACNDSLSTDQRAEEEGFLVSRSPWSRENLSCLHSSESPYIVNIKQEEDMHIRQIENINTKEEMPF